MNFVTSISLVVLGAMFLALLGWGSIRAAWRNCEGRRGVFAALAILAAICSIVAQKPSPDTPTITVDALLRDVGCYATNNVFHAAVTNAPSYAGVDFSDCDLMVYARERASTNAASWFELTPRKKFSQQPADYAIENATNFNYMVYLNYVPPSPVHTNGVFELYGFVIENEAQGEPDQLAAGFINSRAFIAPPTARDYIQDGLVAMWDGIENAGWGVHDANATVWKDLSGNGYHLPLTTNATVEDDAMRMVASNPANYGLGRVSISGSKSSWMVEVCLTYRQYGSGSKIILCVGPITVNNNYPILCAKASKNFEWSYEWNNIVEVFTDGRKLTLTGYRNIGCVNAIQATKSSTDTWGCTENIVCVAGDSRGSGYALLGCSIHSVRLYSRALTAEEIEHNYKIDKERFNLP